MMAGPMDLEILGLERSLVGLWTHIYSMSWKL